MTTEDEGGSSRRPQPRPEGPERGAPFEDATSARPPSPGAGLPLVLGPDIFTDWEQTGHRTRRWFLAGTVGVVLGGAGGVIAASLRHPPPPPPNPPPRALMEALAAERSLLAEVEAAPQSDKSLAPKLKQLHRDHAAHEQALRAVLAGYDLPKAHQSSSGAAPRTSRSAHTPRTSTSPHAPQTVDTAQLRAAEGRAARDSAARAQRLTGRQAALLASIAACEATHVELLK